MRLLEPVHSVQKKVQRHLHLRTDDAELSMRSFALRRFYPHVRGLEGFGGKRVLEIGGTDKISLEPFFTDMGADYLNVRLEPARRRDPRVISGDFMDIAGKFDLVISLGVFELGALDIDFESSRPLDKGYTLPDRALKLSSLAGNGASVVIGTINAPCLLDNRMLEKAGFGILHRESPFYTFMFPDNKGLFSDGDRSELLILYKK